MVREIKQVPEVGVKIDDKKIFKEGQLLYAVLRSPKGRGKKAIILHEASTTTLGGFGYGFGRTWVAQIKNIKSLE